MTASRYSILVAAVIGSAVVPTAIANAFFLPRHLLPIVADEEQGIPEADERQEPARPLLEPRLPDGDVA